MRFPLDHGPLLSIQTATGRGQENTPYPKTKKNPRSTSEQAERRIGQTSAGVVRKKPAGLAATRRAEPRGKTPQKAEEGSHKKKIQRAPGKLCCIHRRRCRPRRRVGGLHLIAPARIMLISPTELLPIRQPDGLFIIFHGPQPLALAAAPPPLALHREEKG